MACCGHRTTPLAVVVVAGRLLAGQSAPGHVLENDHLRVVFSSSGALVELTNRVTGHTYVREGQLPPWRLFYRTGHGYYQPGDALDVEISPLGQRPRIELGQDTITLSYADLAARSPRSEQTRSLQVSLTVKVHLERDQLSWVCTVVNREPEIEVTEVWCPWLSGFDHLGRGPQADVLYWPEAAGRRIRHPRAFLQSLPGASLKLTYPWPASMQWFTFNNGDEGLYVGSHDRTLMTTAFQVTSTSVLDVAVIKYPFVRPGEAWSSPPTVMRLYQGTWHEAARFYRLWTASWLPAPQPPSWIRKLAGWAHPQLGRKGQFGHYRGSYADYPSQWSAARQAGLGALIVFGWVQQGFDNRYPEYEPDPALGGEAALREAIRHVGAAGGRLILYTQGQLIDPVTPFYSARGRAIAAKTIWGDDYREQYAFFGSGTFLELMRNKYFSVACPSAPGWIEQLESQFEQIARYGAHGMIFDQMGGRPPYICFDPAHGHPRPSLANAPGKVANMQRLRQRIKSHDTEFAFVIELAADCYLPWVDITHAWGPGFYPAPDSFGELLRYTYPEAVLTNRSDTPRDRRAHYGHAFTLGLRFDARLADLQDPEVGPYLRRLCELRNQYADLLLEGRFVDCEGFYANNPRVAAHGFLSGNRLAVALWNPEPTHQRVEIVAPGYRLRAIEGLEPRAVAYDEPLGPNEVAVWIFEK